MQRVHLKAEGNQWLINRVQTCAKKYVIDDLNLAIKKGEISYEGKLLNEYNL